MTQPQHIWLISGYAGSGKDTTTAILMRSLDSQHVTHDSFAGAVKDDVAAMYEFDRAYLDTQEGKARIVAFADGTRHTMRDLLIKHAETTKQTTRDPAVWAKRIKAPKTTHWVLSDWRFLEELLCIRMRFPHARIHTLRVKRSSVEPMASHTEHELDSYLCEHIVENEGSLADLAGKVGQVMDAVLIPL